MPKAPTTELGHVSTWAEIAGTPTDELESNPKLQWPQNIVVFDAMRRQDSQVRSVAWALTLPLRRPIWAVDPRAASDQVTREFAEDVGLPIMGENPKPRARTRGRFSWREHLRLALLMLFYGHMGFEQVYRDLAETGGVARLRKLAPRFPVTLAEINVERDGGLKSIKQFPAPGQTKAPEIPVNRLVWYALDREGAAWQGQSILRAVYKDWLLLDRLVRVRAMTVERNGMGVPTIEAPEHASPAQLAELNALASAYRAGDASGGALPYGAHLRLRGVEGSLPDAGAAIVDHRNQIARSVLGQFLQLGTSEGSTGNRALSESMIDFFGLALEAIAEVLCETSTQHVVEDWVDLNYGPDEPAPAIVATPSMSEVEATAEQLAALVNSSLLTPDRDLESELRRRFNLPPRPTDDRTPALRAKRAWAGARLRRQVSAAAEAPAEATESIETVLAAMLDVDTAVVRYEAGDDALAAAEDAVDDDVTPLAAALSAVWTAAYFDGAPGPTDMAGLDDLLATADETAAGIRSTMVDRVKTALAGGRDHDVPAPALRAVLEAIGTDSERASLIAVTETRRAAVRGALDVWRLDGVTSTRWVRGSGVDLDDECKKRDGTSAESWDPPPPLHPRCECSLEPVDAS